MKYNFIEMQKTHPQDAQRAASIGTFDASRIYVTVPKGFRFTGEPPTTTGARGLGDVVAMAAQPIARVIDSTVGTRIATCGGCSKRQDTLNAVFPFNQNSHK